MLKKLAQKVLKFSAKLAIWRNKYKIVAVTGSVGKTSTKKAIILVLDEKYSVLSSEGEGYNTEIGLPLTLIQKTVPKNKAGWLVLMICSPIIALKKRKYDYCVLEMGADKPGDIGYLTDIAKPDISVVTNVSGVHLVDFKNVAEIAKEKEKILSALTKNGFAILNADNEYTSAMKVPEGVEKITFGKKSSEIKVIRQDLTTRGSKNYFKVRGKNIEIDSTALGEHVLYIFSASITVGISQNIPIENITRGLQKFLPAKGRLNIIQGIKNSTIIDDSYNANPVSMKNAIDVLGRFKERKIAVLGSMNELGEHEKSEHEKIGEYLSGKCDILVTVGEAAQKYIASSASRDGFSRENIYSFRDSVQAGNFLMQNIKKGDIVLIKGSQNKIRLERSVKMVMISPENAPKLLCRQGKEWERR